MSWHFLERWLEKVNQHSTLFGKFWITLLVVFRLIIIGTLGDRVYADEQSEFRCSTSQHGCTNVCFDAFSPISHVRFWGFQIILVSFPSVLFILYSGHRAKQSKDDDNEKVFVKKMQARVDKETQEKNKKSSTINQIDGGGKNLESGHKFSNSSSRSSSKVYSRKKSSSLRSNNKNKLSARASFPTRSTESKKFPRSKSAQRFSIPDQVNIRKSQTSTDLKIDKNRLSPINEIKSHKNSVSKASRVF